MMLCGCAQMQSHSVCGSVCVIPWREWITEYSSGWICGDRRVPLPQCCVCVSVTAVISDLIASILYSRDGDEWKGRGSAGCGV